MVGAIVLLNVKPGYETKIKEMLKSNKKVKEAYIVYGEFDIVAKIEVEDIYEIRDFVINVIRKLEGVEKSITLIIAD